ncbi:hypothetical protein RJ639_045276 [Escallonia herrerae]|uniref:Ty3 transposon capsid-like protein domain-containing protein n=1 Tax=Escallonia herrerae TaxID=1293975 RepID=A0AA88W717_9ASTE|nr:hypothetical protein RJ639_045276 [Escallonia herrerae]
MPETRSYDGTREARQVDNLFWHLERYFEALDIDDEKEKVQTVVMYLNDTAALRWRRRYTDECDIKTWEKFKHELKRQFYPESVVDIAMINLRRLRQNGSICLYVKVYSAPEMSERQQLCFFIDWLQQWVATKLRRREPHDLASAMAIIEKLEDFKQCDRPRSPRHERAKDEGYGRSKSCLPKATNDEWSGDEGHRRHHIGKKKHGKSHKRGDSRDHKAHGGLRRECFYCAGKDCLHKGKITTFLEKHKGNKGDSSSNGGEACMGALQMVNAFMQKSKEKTAKKKKSKKRNPKVDVAEKAGLPITS